MSLFGKPAVAPLPPLPDAAVNPPPLVTANAADPMAARARAARQAQAMQGRSSTILTSPQGLRPTAPIGSTLLGS